MNQDAKIPNWGTRPMKRISSPIFTSAKRVFSSGTHTDWRRPIKALSCNTKIDQVMVARIKTQVSMGY